MSTPAVQPITNAELASSRWWRDLLARAGRNIVQVLTPALVLAATTGDLTLGGWALVISALIAGAVTVLRALTGLRVATGTSFPLEAADRALAAGVSALAAYTTADGFDVLNADWTTITKATIGAMLLALAAMVTNRPQPPSVTEPPVESIPEVPPGPGRDDIDPSTGGIDGTGPTTATGDITEPGEPLIDPKPYDPYAGR